MLAVAANAAYSVTARNQYQRLASKRPAHSLHYIDGMSANFANESFLRLACLAAQATGKRAQREEIFESIASP